MKVYNIGEITVKLTDTGSKINFNELREYMIDNQLMSEPACSLNLLNTLMKQEKANRLDFNIIHPDNDFFKHISLILLRIIVVSCNLLKI